MNTTHATNKQYKTQQEVEYINKAMTMYDKAMQLEKIEHAHKSSVLSYVVLAVIFIAGMGAVAYMVSLFIK